MKSILALATLSLAALVVEEKARQAAVDAHDAYGVVVDQARGAAESLNQKVKRKPFIALLIAGSLGYVLASVLPRGN